MMLWLGKRYLIIPAAAGTISSRFGRCKCCMTVRGSCDKITTSEIRKQWEAVTPAGCWGKQGSSSWSISSAWLSPVAEIHGLNNPWVCVSSASWSHLNSLDDAGSALLQPLGLRLLFPGGVWMFLIHPLSHPSSVPAVGNSLSLVGHQLVWPAHISAQNPKSSFSSPHLTDVSQIALWHLFFPLESAWKRAKRGFRIPFFLLQLKIHHVSVNDVVCQISWKCPECCD